jgi:branched-chain amino acid transport system substrate-binding protein
MAADDVNRGGARRFELVIEDDEGRPESTAAVVERLLSARGVVAIIGADTSGGSLAAAPLCERARVPMVSPTASAPGVTKGRRYMFRVCATDDLEARTVARLATERLHAHRAVIVRDTKNDYSTGMASTFREAFGDVARVLDYSAGDSDFRAQLTVARSLHPDVLFVPGYYSDVAQIAIQAGDLGITAPMIGGSGWDSPKLTEIGGKALDGSWFVTGGRSASPGFVRRFRQRFGADPDTASALAYDAVAVVCAAVSRGGPLADAIAATRDFPGASGAITIGPDHNAQKPLAVFQIENGKFVEKGIIQ